MTGCFEYNLSIFRMSSFFNLQGTQGALSYHAVGLL